MACPYLGKFWRTESYLARGDALVSEVVFGVDRAHQLNLVLLVTRDEVAS